MNTQHIPREHAFSKPSLTFWTTQQEVRPSPLSFPAGIKSGPVCTEHNDRRTVEEQSYPQPPRLLWSLPQKRPNRSQTSEGVQDPEESHPRAFSGIYSAKRLKCPATPPLTSQISCNSVVTTGSPRPLLNLLDAKTSLTEREDHADDDQLEFNCLKNLSSPFKYTQEFVTSHTDPIAKNGTDPHRPLPNGNPPGYIYFAPTNPSDKANQALNTRCKVPRRQLSYRGPASNPGPRPLHKSTGSGGLRHDAKQHAEDYSIESRSYNTPNASVARPYDSEPVRRKPRLRLDLSEQKDEIQEAHAITIRTSPSKPQVICTPRRRATIDPFTPTTPAYRDRGLPMSYPHTPPPTLASSESVAGLEIKSLVDKKYDGSHERIKTKPTWNQTPPMSNPSPTATVKRGKPDTITPVGAVPLGATAPDQTQLTQITSWIIMELEEWVASIPQVNLQLDSPVMIQICLPAGQRRVPKKTLPTLPLSRYSNFKGPLSSHPTHSPFNSHLQIASPPIVPAPPTNLRSLRIIFPHASSQLLSSLQATYLALRYISTIHLSPPSSHFPPFSYSKTHAPLSPNMPYIPAKARAMLGLQTPATRPGLPASWRRPETRGWRERIENLECKLRREVIRLIRMCEGSNLGKNDALVRAVGQIVNFEQENARRLR